ncbi:unnamed protein product [Miscanthus lutarioriparius]|uniref:Uncharacterized protein n=1 Tax=Miscanthus lutarioriparius TaxID=422564 RepID=A0A811QYI4_9POAL|nr:unnamed protein product [Miscanthus lutarioriparius]
MGKPKGKKKAEEEEAAAAAKSWLAWKSRVAYPSMSCLASLSVLGRSAAASAAGSGRCCHHEALKLLLRRIASQLARVGWGDGDGRTLLCIVYACVYVSICSRPGPAGQRA